VLFRFGADALCITHADAASLMAAVQARLTAGSGFALATLNLDHLVKLRRDGAFRRAYAAQDMVVADGNPVVWLSRLAGRPVSLVPGADMVVPLVQVAARAGRPLVMVGATPSALSAAAAHLQALVPGLVVGPLIAPSRDFDPDGPEAQAILAQIAAVGPCLCLVALGAPKQERLAAAGRAIAPQAGFAGIGAGVDFLAGAQARAPEWVRALAMEWLWRMLRQPRRMVPRYAACAAILPSEALRALRLRWRGA
jgi:N-acetylglucosaminyldiphosphoundecaprenol N-acetyl-beta-D-mannosaminyltransferase